MPQSSATVKRQTVSKIMFGTMPKVIFFSEWVSAWCRRSFLSQNGFRHDAEGRFFLGMGFGMMPKVVFFSEWVSARCRRLFLSQNGFRQNAEDFLTPEYFIIPRPFCILHKTVLFCDDFRFILQTSREIQGQMSSFEIYWLCQKTAPSRENGLSKPQARLLHAVCACNYIRLPLTRQHKPSVFVSRFAPCAVF